jgi:hypothetical protein
MKATKTLAAINAKLEATQDRSHRAHLGASILGGSCVRAVWYSFRWAARETFSGRMLRLFNRGEREEAPLLNYLSAIGCKVWPIDPATGKQWRVSFANGHGGGSTDGVAMGIPELGPNVPFLIECKTHNDASFRSLQNEGLCQSKPQHFGQMQIYMHGLELPAGLYMAINKNDDDLHLEIVQPNPGFAATLIDRAEFVVDADSPPQKINKSPGYYVCKFCKFRDICHNEELPEVNCRTCHFSKPIEGGKWFCAKYGCELSTEQQSFGCHEYKLKGGFFD